VDKKAYTSTTWSCFTWSGYPPSAGWHMSIQDPKLPTLWLVKAGLGWFSPPKSSCGRQNPNTGDHSATLVLSYLQPITSYSLFLLVRDRLPSILLGVKFRHFTTQNKTRVVSNCGLAISIQVYSFIYGNSNISPCKNINLQKHPLKQTKILQDIITLHLISSFNTSQNIIFQKTSYKNRRST
jgi:hypothetical protein